MHYPDQYQSAGDVGEPMLGGATINGSGGAFLAYPHRNYGVHMVSHDPRNYRITAQPNGEGLALCCSRYVPRAEATS